MPRMDMQNRGLLETTVTSAARASSGNSGTIDGFGAASTVRAQVNVTAASGTTPTLDVVIEDTLDGVNFNTIGTFAQKTVVAREVINITAPFSNQCRVRWTIGGTTPSFTFSVAIYSK